MDILWWTLCSVQGLAGARVVSRLARTARGRTIGEARGGPGDGRISVLVPVLDEEARLGPCLDALAAQDGRCVREILVVDGGSRDRTADVVARAAARDARVRFVAAGPPPAGWNGKAWNLQTGLLGASADCDWILTVDADVRAAPGLAAALVAFAGESGVRAFGVATRQRLADALDAIFHPAMLTTLVYRYGIPGTATDRVARVAANGQCFFARRDLLLETNAVEAARDSRCEDVTIARALAAAGTAVGFYETRGLVRVEMYERWQETVANWPRSLPMVDRFCVLPAWLGMADVALAQALPLWVALIIVATGAGGAALVALQLQGVLIALRLGVLAGTRRAYERPPATYWLSPLADAAVAGLLIASAVRRNQRWRGRTLVR
jgi:dolichol-phosphate mannosyltransferase